MNNHFNPKPDYSREQYEREVNNISLERPEPPLFADEPCAICDSYSHTTNAHYHDIMCNSEMARK